MKLLSRVRLFANPWTVANQAPPSMEFSRQEYWSVLPCPSAGDLSNPGINPGSPAFQADTLPSEPPGKPQFYTYLLGYTGLPMWLSGIESSCHAGDLGSVSGWGRSPAGGNDNPLQYSCLGNPTKEPGWLQSMGLQRVGHDLATKEQQQFNFITKKLGNHLCIFACIFICGTGARILPLVHGQEICDNAEELW